MTASASGTVTGKIGRKEVWGDGVKKYSTYGSNMLKASFSLASGAHHLGIYSKSSSLRRLGNKKVHQRVCELAIPACLRFI